jgi:phospholipid N-methyltransferase
MGRGGNDRSEGRGRFLRSFLDSPRKVGAVLPTSRRTVRDTLDLAPLERARCVVELGAGTGVYTREILDRIGPEARLLAFEIDPNLAAALSAQLRDPRLSVITDSAAEVARHLGGDQVDVVVSGVPFTSLPHTERRRILDAARDALALDGAMLVLQYSPFIQRELERMFASVSRRISPLNVPPAFLFACRGDARSAVAQQ